jgi:hypothetical protein
MKNFREVKSNPDIIIKFHKDVFMLEEEKVSITVFDPDSNSTIYTEERKLVDEENDVNRLVAHFLLRVEAERGVIAQAATEAKEEEAAREWQEKDRRALKDAEVILTFYSPSETLKKSILQANRNNPNECHVYLRGVMHLDNADVLLDEKTEGGVYVLTLKARDNEVLHSERVPERSSKRAVTSMSKWITSTPWESSAEAARRVTGSGLAIADDSPIAPAEADSGVHPVPGKSAIHIVTDVLGATATLYGPAGRELSTCQTPCRFNNLAPLRYGLQVQKQGYVTLQTEFDTKPDQALDQNLHLEAVAKGLYIASRPGGADIFINGAKQSGQTPTSLPLGPGQYDLVLRLPGYEAYASYIQVKDNIQTTVDFELKPKQEMHVAWAQVNSTPQGASIFIDGAPTDQVTPARVQVPTGVHIISLRLNGYQVAKHPIQASEGGIVDVTETLHPK